MNNVMTYSENFALNQWLSDYPSNLEYDEIIIILKNAENEWTIDEIWVWEIVEDCTLDQVAVFIEDTKNAFERTINSMKAEGLIHE
jgi:hypothetical protein